VAIGQSLGAAITDLLNEQAAELGPGHDLVWTSGRSPTRR
jgi:hypothetical protein